MDYYEHRWFVYLLSGGIGLFGYLSLLFFGLFAPFCKSFTEYNKKHYWLRPNCVSFWRTLLLIIGVLFYFKMEGEAWYYVSISMIVIGAFGDAYDGLIARITGEISEWGKWLDPFLDKISYLTPLSVFAYEGYISLPLHAVTVIIDILIGQFAVRFILRKREKSVAAIWPGKLKTVLFFILIFFCDMARFGETETAVTYGLQITCLVFTILSAGWKLKPLIKEQ